jgi:hypothetical protein
MRRFVALCLIGLFLAMPFVVAQDSVGPYNPIADVNKDGVVDILDLVDVGQSYGSNCTSLIEPNMTTVLVLSYDNNSQVMPVANAIVSVLLNDTNVPPHWKSANSTGMATFDLDPNRSYFIMAWSSDYTEYNYVSVTTNSQGEAFATIWLSYPLSPNNSPSPIRTSPEEKAVVVIIDRNTSLPLSSKPGWPCNVFYLLKNVSVQQNPPRPDNYSMNFIGYTISDNYGIACFPYVHPNIDYLVCLYTGIPPGYTMPICVFHTDQYGGAYTIVTIDYPW